MENTAATKTIRSEYQNTETLSERFGVVDSKGREIGGSAQIFEIDFTPAAPTATSYWTQEPGHYFGFRPHATRDGQHFGALHHSQTFATAAERDRAVAKYFAGARKRAAKKTA